MDRDKIILLHETKEAEDIENGVNSLIASNDDQSDRLHDMQSKIDEMYRRLGKTKAIAVPKTQKAVEESKISDTSISYDELFEMASKSLGDRGIDVDDISFDELINDKELEKILEELDAPLPREDKWKKSDFIAVFVVAIIGCAIDSIIGNRDNKFTGKGSKFSDWLDEIHTKKIQTCNRSTY